MKLEDAAQARFDALRRAHYPAELNKIAAHLTLFHTLPNTDEVRDVLMREAASLRPFTLRVSGVRSLGRGVAYFMDSPKLLALHGRLTRAFNAHLSPQDRQGFRPHIVVQNKVSGEEARALLAKLQAVFMPFEIGAEGLAWWNYLGGPWERRGFIHFR